MPVRTKHFVVGAVGVVAVGAAVTAAIVRDQPEAFAGPPSVERAFQEAGVDAPSETTRIGHFTVWFAAHDDVGVLSLVDTRRGGVGPGDAPQPWSVGCRTPRSGERLTLCGGIRWAGLPSLYAGTADGAVRRVSARFASGRTVTVPVVDGLFVIEGARPRGRALGSPLARVQAHDAQGAALGEPFLTPDAREQIAP